MCDLPPNQIKLAREYAEHEIMLTFSGYRKPKDSNPNLAKSEDHNFISVSDESIPLKCMIKNMVVFGCPYVYYFIQSILNLLTR